MSVGVALLSVSDVAKLTGLSRKAVYRAIQDRELRAAKLRGRLLIRPTDFDAWFDANVIENSPLPSESGRTLRRTPGNRGLRRLLNPTGEEAPR